MGRSPCCSKEGLNRGAWTAMEDRILTDYIKTHGEGQWRDLPKRAGLKRCGKSCRLRWLNYLRPDIKRGNITDDEEELIIRLHKLLGNRWSLIAGRLPGRTDNEIKNYWNTNIGKRLQLQQQGQQLIKNLKPSNQSKRKANANANANANQTHSSSSRQQQQPSKASSTPSLVVRTKATRCTRVFINIPEILPHLQDTKPSMPQLLIEDTKPSSPEYVVSKDKLEDIDPSNFIIDNLELDENFLSEFLGTDFSQLHQPSDHLDHINHGFENKGDHSYSNSDTCTDHDQDQDQGQYSSTNSDDQSLFFTNDHIMHDTDFTSMAALMDSDFDWLQDQAETN